MTAPPGAKAGLTHPCARCGAAVPLDVGLCERCNPLGLRDSSSSQVHGIAIAGVMAFIIFLAVVARLSVSGIGPFEAGVVNAVPDRGGLSITVQVTNGGSSGGQTMCRVTDPADRTGNTGGFILSPAVEAGQTMTFTGRVTELGATVRPLVVACSSP